MCPVYGAFKSALKDTETIPADLNASSSAASVVDAAATAEARECAAAAARNASKHARVPCAAAPPTADTPLDPQDEPRAQLAELGRAAWRVIHAAANHVDTSLDLDRFVQFMRGLLPSVAQSCAARTRGAAAESC